MTYIAQLDFGTEKLRSGYAYEFHGGDWEESASDDWDTALMDEREDVAFIGRRWIDGSEVAVWAVGAPLEVLNPA
jgi:hypothetical protein